MENHKNDMVRLKKRRKMMRPPGKVKIVDTDDEPSADDDGPSVQKVKLDEHGLAMYYAELEVWKDAWEAEHTEGVDLKRPFATTYRHSPSTYKKKGLAVDFIRATWQNDVAKRWLLRYGLQQSFDMSVKTHAPNVTGGVCEAWNHRMLYLFNIWCAAGCDREHVYRPEVAAAYVESDEFRHLEPTLQPNALARVAHLRTLTPTKPLA